MYLKLSVAGHLTIFLTRTRGPFWSIRPARILMVAVFGTQAVATLIAVYGLFMTPLGWGWALFVWAYALAWFLVNDRVKLLAYWLLDASKGKPKPNGKVAAQPDAKDKPAPKTKAVAELKTGVESMPEAKAEPKSEAKTAAEPNAKAAAPDVKAPAQPQEKAAPKPEAKPEAEAAAQPQAEAAPKPEANSGVATLLDTSLGDLLVAGLVKDPEDAGRVIAAALTQVGTPAATPPEAEPKSNVPPAATPRTAK
jgi:H+-transporting ATPase